MYKIYNQTKFQQPLKISSSVITNPTKNRKPSVALPPIQENVTIWDSAKSISRNNIIQSETKKLNVTLNRKISKIKITNHAESDIQSSLHKSIDSHRKAQFVKIGLSETPVNFNNTNSLRNIQTMSPPKHSRGQDFSQKKQLLKVVSTPKMNNEDLVPYGIKQMTIKEFDSPPQRFDD